MKKNVIIVDDEIYSINQIEYLLCQDPSYRLIGKFVDPSDALEKINDLKPQVAFLDISMPNMNGLELGASMTDILPDLIIVYLTAHDEFALEAFGIAAVDYILKPVSPKRFGLTLRRISKRVELLDLFRKHEESKQTDNRLIVQTLGGFMIGRKNEEPLKWRTEKMKELFAFLLHNANKEIPKEVLIDTVFDDVDLKFSAHNLHNNIYYIKKALRDYGIPSSQIDIERKYMLRINGELIDICGFKKGMKQARQNWNIESLTDLEKLYTGDYFEGMDWLWADLERENLLNQYISLITNLSAEFIQQKRYQEAEELLLKAFQRDAYMEEVTGLLITLYSETNRADLALKHYRKYEKILLEDLGIHPDAEIRNLISYFKQAI